MDLATIIGLLAGAAVIAMAIFLGGTISQFADLPSVLIVVGGGTAATLIRFPIAGVANALLTGGKVAFIHKKVGNASRPYYLNFCPWCKADLDPDGKKAPKKIKKG